MPLTMDAPVQLFTFQEPETTLGVIAVMDTWAVSPEESERLGVGQYSLHVQFEADGLIPDEYLPNTETLTASASFSLTASSGHRTQHKRRRLSPASTAGKGKASANQQSSTPGVPSGWTHSDIWPTGMLPIVW